MNDVSTCKNLYLQFHHLIFNVVDTNERDRFIEMMDRAMNDVVFNVGENTKVDHYIITDMTSVVNQLKRHK